MRNNLPLDYELAAIYGQLGRRKPATPAREMMLNLTLSYESAPPRFIRKLIRSENVVHHFSEGLRKAGMKLAVEKR